MKLYLKIMWIFLKYGLPVMILLLPTLAVVGVFVEWDQDREIIENAYSEYNSVFAGYGYESTTYQGTTKSNTQRSYWLIPKNISLPKVLSINFDEAGNVSHEASVEGFWFLVITNLVIVIACYFIWVRGYDPFNKLSKRDTEKLGAPS